MSSHEQPSAAGTESAATYRIRINGRLDESWSVRLGGLAITDGGANVTTLTGPLRDQSELIGVLNTLHLLRLTVTSVERVAGNAPKEGERRDPSETTRPGTVAPRHSGDSEIVK